MPKIALFLLLATFLISDTRNAFAACRSKLDSKEILQIAFSNLPLSLDPIDGWHYQHFLLVQSVFQSLVRVNEDGQVVAAIAKTWIPSENGKKYEFTLDPQAKFHDGKKVTTQDVIYSFARHLWPNTPSVMKERLASIIHGARNMKVGEIPSGIKLLSNDTVEFTLIGSYPAFLRLIAMPTFAIVSENSFKNPHNPNGNGPMEAHYDVKSQKWILSRYKGYQLAKVTNNGFTVRQVENTSQAISQIKSGKLDLYIGASIASLKSLPENIETSALEALAVHHLFFNNRKLIFKDRELRHDIALAMNEVARFSENDFLQYSPYFIPKGILPISYYQRTLPQFNESSITSKWSRQLAGTKIKIVLRSEYFNEEMANAILNKLKKFGFDPHVLLTNAAKVTPILKTGEYDIISGGYMAGFSDPDAFVDLISTARGTRNYGNIPSANFINTIEKIQLNGNNDERLKLYAKYILAFENEWFFIPLFRLKLPYVHTKYLVIPDSHYRYEPELWKTECRITDLTN